MAGLALLFPMAFLAGATDACALEHIPGDNGSFMSGNLVTLAIAAGHGDRQAAIAVALTLAAFVAGAVLGGLIVQLVRQHAAAVTFASAAILLAPLAWPELTVYALAFAMGVLNAAISRTGPISVGLTFSTGNLVRFGQGLGRAVCGHPEGGLWILQLLPVLGLACGALAATLVQARWGSGIVWPLPAIAFALASWCAVAPPKR